MISTWLSTYLCRFLSYLTFYAIFHSLGNTCKRVLVFIQGNLKKVLIELSKSNCSIHFSAAPLVYIWQLDTIFWGVLKRALFDGHPFIHIKLLPKLFTHGGKLLCCSSPLVWSGRCLAQVYLDVGLFLFSGKLHCLTKLVPSSYSWPGQFC